MAPPDDGWWEQGAHHDDLEGVPRTVPALTAEVFALRAALRVVAGLRWVSRLDWTTQRKALWDDARRAFVVVGRALGRTDAELAEQAPAILRRSGAASAPARTDDNTDDPINE